MMRRKTFEMICREIIMVIHTSQGSGLQSHVGQPLASTRYPNRQATSHKMSGHAMITADITSNNISHLSIPSSSPGLRHALPHSHGQQRYPSPHCLSVWQRSLVFVAHLVWGMGHSWMSRFWRMLPTIENCIIKGDMFGMICIGVNGSRCSVDENNCTVISAHQLQRLKQGKEPKSELLILPSSSLFFVFQNDILRFCTPARVSMTFVQNRNTNKMIDATIFAGACLRKG